MFVTGVRRVLIVQLLKQMLPKIDPLQSIKVGSPMQIVAVDIVGPFPESCLGNSYILVIGDYFTCWMEAFPIPNQEATTVARVLTNEVFYRFSPPEQLPRQAIPV